eukprot:6185894-Pleurochrysis_carterae.AAC.1
MQSRSYVAIHARTHARMRMCPPNARVNARGNARIRSPSPLDTYARTRTHSPSGTHTLAAIVHARIRLHAP